MTTGLLFAACGRERVPVGEGFGSQYGYESARIDGELLTITIGYASCGADAVVSLHHRIVDGAARVWLRKDSREEPCDMAERTTYSLPPEVHAASRITLYTPGGQQWKLREPGAGQRGP